MINVISTINYFSQGGGGGWSIIKFSLCFFQDYVRTIELNPNHFGAHANCGAIYHIQVSTL